MFYYPIPSTFYVKSQELRKAVTDYLEEYEQTGELSHEHELVIQQVNVFQKELSEWIEKKSNEYLSKGKKVAILGGEHSVPFGLLKALDSMKDFGILQIDAHADLRESYEGFEQSHASIMYNALGLSNLRHITSVGVRDYAPIEAARMQSESKLTSFTWGALSEKLFKGETWSTICQEIIATLPEKIYVSFDIDGLSPEYCPNTGTPVPGGLSFYQARYLLWELKASGREIIGFDLCEVSPGENDWDANVGARILWELCLAS